MFRDLFVGSFSIFLSLLVLLVALAIGWFVIWKLFLSKFKFVRELLGGMQEEETVEQEKITRKSKKIRRD